MTSRALGEQPIRQCKSLSELQFDMLRCAYEPPPLDPSIDSIDGQMLLGL
jgi:hypothetical protein